MESRPMCITLMESSTFMTLAGLSVVLLTVAGMVIGMGMSMFHMWLIMASVCVVWLSFCRCITWQRKTTQRLRTAEMASRHAAIGTISDGIRVDNMAANRHNSCQMSDHIMMAIRDAPPSYDVINTGLDQPPPSYSSVVAKLNPGVVSFAEGESPPPYNSVTNHDTPPCIGAGLENYEAGGAPRLQQSDEYICDFSDGKATTDA